MGYYFIVKIPVGIDIVGNSTNTNVWVAGTVVDQWGQFNGGSSYSDDDADYNVNII